MIADHLGGANKKADAATPEDSSAVRQKGDAMSETARLTAERDEARANAERLRIDAERYQWLRSSQTHKSVGCIEFGVWGALLNGPELDAAVDRGMLASANEGGRNE